MTNPGSGLQRRFGTFEGVFVPTLLTILGVILFLREGWVVGNAGLLGAWAVIGASVAITAATGLSLSSVASNTRLPAGGAYAIIRRSFGLEVAGSLGLPLYVSQGLVVAMYLFGFREGWLRIFPAHDALTVDLVAFGGVYLVAAWSAGLAFRAQYVVLAAILAALASIFAAPPADPEPIRWVGTFPGSVETGFSGTTLAGVFAVFFPATTGILVGANMSGELRDPRRSIPLGTLSAIALSAMVYLGMAWWLARLAPPEQLVRDYTLLVDRAWSSTAVLIGLLGATLSSALGAAVGAPRILQTLATDGVVPAHRWLATVSDDGEPRRAMAATAAITLLGLSLRDLNAIAPLVTGVFLLTYTGLNAVVVLEQGLGLFSFRPALRLPLVVPLLGAVGCMAAMVVLSPAFAAVALAVVVVTYGILSRRDHPDGEAGVRSGLYQAVAAWAAGHAEMVALPEDRLWQPRVVVPVGRQGVPARVLDLAADVTAPRGWIALLGLGPPSALAPIATRIAGVRDRLGRHGQSVHTALVETPSLPEGLSASLEALQASFPRPNLAILALPRDASLDAAYPGLERRCRTARVGLVMVPQLTTHTGAPSGVVVWVRDQGPEWSQEIARHRSNLDLALLLGLRIAAHLRVRLEVVTTVARAEEVPLAQAYLARIADQARLPDTARLRVQREAFDEALLHANPTHLHLLGAPRPEQLRRARVIDAQLAGPCVFVRSAGHENVFS